ncbi:uncharacterized protein TM35_000801070, partial [Trypanosoma theileri]
VFILLFWSFVASVSLCRSALVELGGAPGPPGLVRVAGSVPHPCIFFWGVPGAPSGFCRRDLCFHVLVVAALLFAAPRVALWLWASASHGVGWPPRAGFYTNMPLVMRAAFICRQGVGYMNLFKETKCTH